VSTCMIHCVQLQNVLIPVDESCPNIIERDMSGPLHPVAYWFNQLLVSGRLSTSHVFVQSVEAFTMLALGTPIKNWNVFPTLKSFCSSLVHYGTDRAYRLFLGQGDFGLGRSSEKVLVLQRATVYAQGVLLLEVEHKPSASRVFLVGSLLSVSSIHSCAWQLTEVSTGSLANSMALSVSLDAQASKLDEADQAFLQLLGVSLPSSGCTLQLLRVQAGLGAPQGISLSQASIGRQVSLGVDPRVRMLAKPRDLSLFNFPGPRPSTLAEQLLEPVYESGVRKGMVRALLEVAITTPGVPILKIVPGGYRGFAM
jgi:hypothetical protein